MAGPASLAALQKMPACGGDLLRRVREVAPRTGKSFSLDGVTYTTVRVDHGVEIRPSNFKHCVYYVSGDDGSERRAEFIHVDP